MTNEFVLEAITREFPESVLHVSEPYGMLTLEIKKEDLKKVVHHLRDSSLEINFLTDVCGIHYPQDPEKELGVIYHLHNMKESGERVPDEGPVPRRAVLVEEQDGRAVRGDACARA